MLTIKIQKNQPDVIIPQLATVGAACVDVIAHAIEYIPGSDEALVKLGFSLEIPTGYKVCLSPRSSFTKETWLMQNSPAQIDSDYRGELMLKFRAIPRKVVSVTGYGDLQKKQPQVLYSSFPYKVGDRVAQMWVEKVIDYTFIEVEELSVTERGEGGFGSTGQ